MCVCVCVCVCVCMCVCVCVYLTVAHTLSDKIVMCVCHKAIKNIVFNVALKLKSSPYYRLKTIAETKSNVHIARNTW